MTDETIVDFKGPRFDGTAPEVPPCLILPLGHYDGRYVFLAPDGQLRQFGYRELGSAAGQASLFDGDVTYLKARWPRKSREGQILEDYDPKAAAAGLMEMCAQRGMWDPATSQRGRGIWLIEPENRLICHSGDRLLLGGIDEEGPPGIRAAGAIYPRRPAVMPPAIEPAAAQAVRELKRDFAWWRFQPLGFGGIHSDRGPDGLAAQMLFNATCLAMLGAAPRWRVHVLVKAVLGAGKSTLLEFVQGILGAGSIMMNNASEAGFRLSASDEARTVLLDEAEGDDPLTGVMSGIIRDIRQMSGGMHGARGAGGDAVRHFEIAVSAFLFCINMPVLLPQDMSRFLVLEMLPAIAVHERQARLAIERATQLSPALRARAFYGWDRFRENLNRCRAALVFRGCTGRQADLIGSLLAAGAMMLDDRPIDDRAADDLTEAATSLIDTMRVEQEDNSDAMQCWRRLINHRADKWRSGEALTVGMLLREAQDQGGTSARAALTDYYGMRIVNETSATMVEAPCLYVVRDKQHGFLREVYHDTRWREGVWGDGLGRLPGAVPISAKSPRIGGLPHRCIAIPLRYLPRPERDWVGEDEPDG
jgi:hypothetical protein